MTTIRSNPLPLSGHGAQAQDSARLAAQRQFFATLRQAQGAAAPAAPAVAGPTQSVAPAVVAQTASAPPAEAPQKLLRPGSLIDIRV